VRITLLAARGTTIAVGLLLGLAGCTFGTQPHATSPEAITEPVVPSAFVAVVSGPAIGSSLATLVADTTRPGEYLEVLRTDPSAVVLTAT
jgi:hypothetical protein